METDFTGLFSAFFVFFCLKLFLVMVISCASPSSSARLIILVVLLQCM
jgi:hypothetical protein